MDKEYTAIGLITIIVMIVISIVSIGIYDLIDGDCYADIASEITVRHRYSKIDEKKAVVDSCMRILETNGYTMCKADVEKHGTYTFIAIKGVKYLEKDSK